MGLSDQQLTHRRSRWRKGIQSRGTVESSSLRRTQDRANRRSRGLQGVGEAARKDSTLKFNNLLHHVNRDLLAEAFFDLKKTAAVGVDKVTWYEYERNV